MPRRWRVAAFDRGVVGQLARELSISGLLAQVLAARGIDDSAHGRVFLESKLTDLHAPELLPGLSEASQRIVDAVRAGRRITIYGDYDVDGVSATSILWHCLKLVQANVDYYIPSRLEEGYGLNAEALRSLHAEDPQRLVVTVDCGICSVEHALLARDLGLELIITDHHTFGEQLPESLVNVHPRLPGSTYPFGELCGAGVAFKLAWGICQLMGDGTKASPRMREYLKSAVGLATLGTVADVVPLVGENRIIVKYGLQALTTAPMPGLEMLLKVAGIDPKKRLTAEDIAFGLAPRINAAGRLGQARLAVELLTTDNRARAAQLADYMDKLNKDRQTVERRMFKQVNEIIESHPEWGDHAALVVAHEEFHAGVLGIVASRVAEKYQRPAIIMCLNGATQLGQGSGRSFNGFDLHGGLAACGHLLEGFGGHRAAAGVRLRLDRLDEFREAFAAHAARCAEEEGAVDEELDIDAEVSLHDLTPQAVRELEFLGPFGAAHRRPVFCVNRVELADPAMTMGNGGQHLSLKVRQGDRVTRCIAFGKGDWAAEINGAGGGELALCFSPSINVFKGRESVELMLHDWQCGVRESGQLSGSPPPPSSTG